MKKLSIKHFVIFSLTMVIVYSIAEFVAGCFGINHDTLTTGFLACFGGELLATCVIKIFSNRGDDSNDE